MGGKKPEEYKGVAKFFTFLSDTDRQVAIHKSSGYLPITKAAYAKTKESGYYKDAPYLETPLLELTNKEPTENSRGLRLGNMVQLRDVWAEEFEAALSGKKIRQGGARRRRLARQRDAAAVRAHGARSSRTSPCGMAGRVACAIQRLCAAGRSWMPGTSAGGGAGRRRRQRRAGKPASRSRSTS